MGSLIWGTFYEGRHLFGITITMIVVSLVLGFWVGDTEIQDRLVYHSIALLGLVIYFSVKCVVRYIRQGKD